MKIQKINESNELKVGSIVENGGLYYLVVENTDGVVYSYVLVNLTTMQIATLARDTLDELRDAVLTEGKYKVYSNDAVTLTIDLSMK